MYCQSCGHPLQSDARFCPICGHAASVLPKPANPAPSQLMAAPVIAERTSPQERLGEFTPMPLKHVLFSIHGRIGRVKFLTGWVLLWGAYILAALLTALVTPNAPADTVWTSLTIIFLWPNIALWAKRMQDCNYSAFVLLVLFIPIIGFAVILYAFFSPGTRGPNKYGHAANVLPLPARTG